MLHYEVISCDVHGSSWPNFARSSPTGLRMRFTPHTSRSCFVHREKSPIVVHLYIWQNRQAFWRLPKSASFTRSHFLLNPDASTRTISGISDGMDINFKFPKNAIARFQVVSSFVQNIWSCSNWCVENPSINSKATCLISRFAFIVPTFCCVDFRQAPQKRLNFAFTSKTQRILQTCVQLSLSH